MLHNTEPFDLTGLPALSVPCGFSQSGLPIGLQIAGRPFAEQMILRVGQAFQTATDWHLRRPPLFSNSALGADYLAYAPGTRDQEPSP